MHRFGLAHNVNHHDISTPEELQAILRQTNGRTIMRFYRHGCPACDSSVGQWLEFVNRPDYKCVTFISLNIDENVPLTKAMNVSLIPTFMMLQKGRPATILEGADMERLRRLIETGMP